MAEPVLALDHVSVVYPRAGGLLRRRMDAVTAVDQVTLDVQPGEALGLVGESGCGKTTLAKLCVGLLQPSAGEVRVQGRPLSALRGAERRANRRAVQLVFQNPMTSLNPRLTVEETLSEPLRIHRLAVGAAARHRRVDELLEAVQLPPAHRRRLPRQLSGGERQRVGIARALATEPVALLCDEPIASLDVSIGAQILELLRGLNRTRRMALVFISHDLRAVAALCSRIAVMRGGQLVEAAATDVLLSRASHPYTELLIRSAELDLDAVEPASGPL